MSHMISKEDARKGREMGRDIARCYLDNVTISHDTVRHLKEYEVAPIPLDLRRQKEFDMQIRIRAVDYSSTNANQLILNLHRRALFALRTVRLYEHMIANDQRFLVAGVEGMDKQTGKLGEENLCSPSYTMVLYQFYAKALKESLAHDPEMMGIESLQIYVTKYEKQLPTILWYDL